MPSLTLEKIDAFFKQGMEDLRQRRKEWEQAVNDVILPTLRKVRDGVPFIKSNRRLNISSHAMASGWGLVQIGFGNEPTGISSKVGKETHHISEEGATLAFSQAEGGSVRTFIHPFQRNHPDLPKYGRYLRGRIFASPSQIAVADIEGLATEFLEIVLHGSVFKPTVDLPKVDLGDWQIVVNGKIVNDQGVDDHAVNDQVEDDPMDIFHPSDYVPPKIPTP